MPWPRGLERSVGASVDAWHRTPALEALWRPLGAHYGNKAQPGLRQRLSSYVFLVIFHIVFISEK